MRATIVVDDNMVYVDGNGAPVDCSALLEQGLHAVQWYDNFGEEEFNSVFNAEAKTVTRKPNNAITDFEPYQSYVDLWQISYDKQQATAALIQKQIDEAWQNAYNARQ